MPTPTDLPTPTEGSPTGPASQPTPSATVPPQSLPAPTPAFTPPEIKRWLIISLLPNIGITKTTPIPYMIVSEIDFAKACSTNVAYRNQLSMHFGSVTSSCRGDEASDHGIKSGTVGEICEPKTSCDNVFINGMGAIRNEDEFYMNKRNCIGKLLIVPAVSGPTSDAEFDLSVASLVISMIKKNGNDPGKSAGELKFLRDNATDPNVYNNPVVVAAEHFFVAQNLAIGGKYFAGKVGVLVSRAATVGYELFKLGNPVSEAIKKNPVWPLVTYIPGHPDYPFDMRVLRWQMLGNMQGEQEEGAGSLMLVVAIYGLAGQIKPDSDVDTPAVKPSAEEPDQALGNIVSYGLPR